MNDQEITDNHPGVEDGHVDDNDEKVVYDLDDKGNMIGWHKEAAE